MAVFTDFIWNRMILLFQSFFTWTQKDKNELLHYVIGLWPHCRTEAKRKSLSSLYSTFIVTGASLIGGECPCNMSITVSKYALVQKWGSCTQCTRARLHSGPEQREKTTG